MSEIERDCLIGYGVSIVLLERLTLSLNAFRMDVCAKCGRLSYQQWCNYCESSQTLAYIQMPYAFKLLFQNREER